MKKGLSRRNLFKYMGAGSAAVAVAGCQKKPEKLIPLLVPPDGIDYAPHKAYQYMTTCQECNAGCGLMVTAREGRAQKAEGNPNHPLNQGALCARGQASMQSLYNPNRLKTPMHGEKALSWEDAEGLLGQKLKEAQGKVVYLGRPMTGSDRQFVEEWLQATGGGKRMSFSAFSHANLKKANEMVFGDYGIPLYDFDKAKFLVSFGTDFLETWGNTAENSRLFAEMHAHRKNGRKFKFVHIGPHMSLTGAKADEWVMIKPGTEGLMALALAHIVHKTYNRYSDLKGYLAQYTPEKVAPKVGVSAARIKKLAHELMVESPSLIIGGGNMLATEQGTKSQMAINLLNMVAGNVGLSTRFVDQEPAENMSHADMQQLITDLNAGRVKVLIVDSVNPVYALPQSSEFKKALKNTFVVSLSSVGDESTHAANLVLPTLTPYESWGDAEPRKGIRSIAQPVMVPVRPFHVKAKEDILLSVNQKLETGKFEGISSYLDYLKQAWKTIQSDLGDSRSFETFWIETLERGGLFLSTPTKDVAWNPDMKRVSMDVSSWEGGESDLFLLPSPSILMGDGSGANKPWLQEVPDPMSQIVWDSWVEIHPETAKKLNIQDRTLVQVETPYGKIEAMAYYHFGIHRQAIAIPFGQGHTQSGEAADGYGVNVLDLLPFKTDKQSGEFAWLTVKAKVTPTHKHAYTVSLDGSPRQAGRGIAGAAFLSEVNHGDHGHHGGHHRPLEAKEFYPDRKETAGYYKPYRWGMTIDLDRCNGCSACVVACYAENNIPVVGKERAALGREMSWIRLERYIEGTGDSIEVRFAPMTCQHCGNAGCEPVCPVYATYHTPEGLNAQVYNRCVGTRYCSNNCAYKVRRFNWFNYQFPAPLDQQLNSTITTRDVGVMEKCTFCVQRIREAQDAARLQKRDVRDGEVVTACQQTCGTKAITFGNLMDPKSEVSKKAMRDDPKHRDRQYEALAEINFKPSITYLKKIKLDTLDAHSHREG